MSTEYTKKLINRSNVKKLALEQAAARTDATFERVSGEFYDELNEKVLETIKNHIATHPSHGKTIFGLSRNQPKDEVQA